MRVEVKKTLEAFSSPVQLMEVVQYFLSSLLVAMAAVYIPEAFPSDFPLQPMLKLLGAIVLLALVFLPSFIAFDVFDRFSDEGFVTVLHPSRHIIWPLNLVFGWTGLGWLFLLIWSLNLPRVHIERVEYEPIDAREGVGQKSIEGADDEKN